MSLPNAFNGRLRLPLVAAPMFLVSGPELVIETCKAGVVGTFPALNQRSSEGFAQWLEQIESALAGAPQAAPFGVNLIVHNSNTRLQQDLELIVRHRVPLVITSIGAVREVVDAVHSYGGLVFHCVTTARMLGADLAYAGSRFINTQESRASAEYKQMICDSRAADVVYTPKVSGIPANFLRPSLDRAGLDPSAADEGDGLKSLQDEAKAWRDIWSAGQGVGAIHDQQPPVAELIERLRAEFIEATPGFAAAKRNSSAN